jgi:hypothetical protein
MPGQFVFLMQMRLLHFEIEDFHLAVFRYRQWV